MAPRVADDGAHELAEHRRSQRRFGLLALVDGVAEIVLLVDARREVRARERDDRRDDRQRELAQVFDPEDDELLPVTVVSAPVAEREPSVSDTTYRPRSSRC